MSTRKEYVAPAITAEDQLEQTSLACSVICLPGTPECPPNPFEAAFQCRNNITKAPMFSQEPFCTEPLGPDKAPIVSS